MFLKRMEIDVEDIPSDSFELRPGTRVGEVILIRLDRDRSIGERWHKNGLNYFRCSCFHSHWCRQYLRYVTERDVYQLTGTLHCHGHQILWIDRDEFKDFCVTEANETLRSLFEIFFDATQRYVFFPLIQILPGIFYLTLACKINY